MNLLNELGEAHGAVHVQLAIVDRFNYFQDELSHVLLCLVVAAIRNREFLANESALHAAVTLKNVIHVADEPTVSPVKNVALLRPHRCASLRIFCAYSETVRPATFAAARTLRISASVRRAHTTNFRRCAGRFGGLPRFMIYRIH